MGSFHWAFTECETLDVIVVTYHGQHALRHTFATRCIESGNQPVVLKTWMGHTNIHITLDVYADVFDKMNDKSVAQFDTYLDSI